MYPSDAETRDWDVKDVFQSKFVIEPPSQQWEFQPLPLSHASLLKPIFTIEPLDISILKVYYLQPDNLVP